MGGGGQTPSTTVQQTRQSNEPPSYIQPYLQKGIQDLTALYDKGSAPGYYPGATVATPSANTVCLNSPMKKIVSPTAKFSALGR